MLKKFLPILLAVLLLSNSAFALTKDSVYLPASTDELIKSYVSGDTVPRFNLNSDGTIEWGSGSGAVDVNLYRSAADMLKTDDSLTVGGNLTITGTITATGGAVNAPIAAGSALTLTNAAHSGKTILLDTAAGSTVTLPAATGSGARFRFQVKTVATSNSHKIQVANGTDIIQGIIYVLSDNSAAVLGYAAGASDDTITLNRTTTGSVTRGEFIEIEDVAAGVFVVHGYTQATGTEATPFSSAV